MKELKCVVSVLLVVAMIFGMVGCGTISEQNNEVNNAAASAQNETKDLSRQDKELIADLIGGKDASNMDDKELDALVGTLVNQSGKQDPSADILVNNPDVYDENGAMTKPFDQIYPELIEKEQVKFSGESILIKMKSATLTDGLKAAGVGALELLFSMEDTAWFEAMLIEGTDAQKALEAVRELKEVMLAEYNYIVQTALAPDSAVESADVDGYGNGNNKPKEQWHLKSCGIPNGYGQMKNSGGSSSTIVAVIDTGVDYDHEDLADNIWVNAGEIPGNGYDDDNNGYIDDYYGVDIVAGEGNGDDTNGHGTHVAGIIAAQNNKLGVVGIAFNVKIMSVKAATHSGTLNQADIAKAVQYAYSMGAEVINMSFGGTACSIAVQDALATAYTRCVLVASAGNSGMPNEGTDYYNALPNYPAALTYVLGVMSVNEQGVESVFTNWDVAAFNGVEYEMYAPGEAIVSTLPNNQYGALSGTSMAAPMVSAIAAILRGEFADRNKYPTKFIYGQLASTSDNYATCCNPEEHTIGKKLHNVPQIVNLYLALTKLPKPEVNVQEYYVFDDPKYSDKNNGDGVIDAGETIALGLVLRNRWGMSENTMVTIDTLSQTGVADPYITIHNPTVNYGSVGTYSTQDAGRVYTDELFTGWENPFLITISEDCPNDYFFTVNVTIRCENALDENDRTIYTTAGEVREYVRSGYILPSIIEEDMVLTPDNLYIIPNATIIQEGVTVRVEPGTHIQFWSDDADDPYADNYIAYLLVNGNFLVEGTKENPVYIYPSQLMSQYNVEIGATKGYVSIKYADITNFFTPDYNYNTATGNRIDLANHCTFRYNYSSYMAYRYLSEGKVVSSALYGHKIGTINAKDCVFYKIGYQDSHYAPKLYGTADRCVFTQCGINYQGTSYKDCVFLGNRLVDQSRPGYNMSSSMSVSSISLPTKGDITYDDLFVYYHPETGTTYVRWDVGDSEASRAYANYLQKVFGGNHVKVETAEEHAWLIKKCDGFSANITWSESLGSYVWYDGTPLDPVVFPQSTTREAYYPGIFYGGLNVGGNYNEHMYEIPGQILPEEIIFNEYVINMDLESTYQLAPKSAPVQLAADNFRFESTDTAVITVSNSGLVTPVGIGTADVWVWSLDKAVRNRVTIHVKEYVALEGLNLQTPAGELAVGEKLVLQSTLTPANTTRNNVTYTSSDEKVAKVDAGGIVTGVSSGKVTITAFCEGFTDTVEILIYQKATSLQLDNIVLSSALAAGQIKLPKVVTDAGAEPVLTWRSTDGNVAVVEDGKLILKALGTTSVIVTDSRSGLSAACLVIVTDEKANPVRQMAHGTAYNCTWVLLEDGSLYGWNNNGVSMPRLIDNGVKAIAPDSHYVLALKENGVLIRWVMDSRAYPTTIQAFSGLEIIDIELYSHENIWVVTADGCAYAKGSANTSGQLGIGSTQTVNEPTLINLDGVVDIENSDSATYLLTDKGELYGVGNLQYTTTADPIRIATDVEKILYTSTNYYCYYLTKDGKVMCFNGFHGESSTCHYNTDGMEQIACQSSSGMIGIRDGKVYTGTSDGKVTLVEGITDAVMVSTYNGTFYVGTASGLLLAFGNNAVSSNAMAGVTMETDVKTPVMIPLTPIVEESLAMPGTNLAEGVLSGDAMLLTFNKMLQTAAPKLYADGVQVTVQCNIEDYNHLRVSRSNGFVAGVTYELVFEANTIRAAGGITNTEELRITFTYAAKTENVEPSNPGDQPDAIEPSAPTEEKVVYETIVDETVQRVITAETLVEKMDAFMEKNQYNYKFSGNAILNPISTDTNVEHWLRIQAESVTVGIYREIPLGGNWWGSINERAIGLQMIDYSDFPNYSRLMYAPYLTAAPENTFPFVTSVTLLDKNGDLVTVVGNEEVTFRVTFNRDMDTTIPLQVRFGSAFPYGDYEVEGQYVNARTWEGKYTLNTLIENGYQYFSISNGCSATDDLELQLDQYRFFFEIDTSAAQALLMQGSATDTGIELKWTQDDFDTLMGYNVYRSTKEDGLYTRVNSTTIPADVMSFFDDTVEPGVVYYYNFTVVKTDLTESEPSGKIIIMSKDTMAPNIYHSPVANAFTGANLVLNATITDNLDIAYANLYYRIAGQSQWQIIRMNKLNDKYSAIIPAAYLTVAGLEYYIEAFDGVSYTYKGSAETPYAIAVQEALDANSLGDVDGDGVITNLDALLLLYAINDKYNMTAEEFARADLNGDGELWAAEALRILQYVSGVVGSVKM